MTLEELQRQLEAAKQESDRLKAELTKAKSEGATIEEMKILKTQLSTAEASLNAVTTELTALKASLKENNTVDVDAIVRAAVDATKAAYDPQIKELSQRLTESEKERQATALSSHRALKISEAVSAHSIPQELLVAMVPPNASTTEAIDAAIATAVAIIKKNIPAGSRPQGQGNPPAGSNFAPPAGDKGGDGNGEETDAQLLGRAKDMSTAEYAKYRSRLKQAAANLVRTSNPLVR